MSSVLTRACTWMIDYHRPLGETIARRAALTTSVAVTREGNGNRHFIVRACVCMCAVCTYAHKSVSEKSRFVIPSSVPRLRGVSRPCVTLHVGFASKRIPS